MTPRICLIISIICIQAIVWGSFLTEVLVVNCISVTIALCLMKRYDALRTSLILLLPFCIPSFLIHIFLAPNHRGPNFELGDISISGFYYAIHLNLIVLLIIISISVWKTVSRDRAFNYFLSLSFIPQQLSILIMLSLSIFTTILNKSEKIRIAQLSRGVNVNGNFKTRVLAFTKTAIPLIAFTIKDASKRGFILENRKIGAKKFTLQNTPYSSIEKFYFLSSILLFLINYNLVLHLR